jgi:hypothetical protein
VLENPGHLPPDCIVRDEWGDITGYRSVHVVLFNGYSTKKAGAAPWPAAGAKIPTEWRISRKPHPFEIKEYEIV